MSDHVQLLTPLECVQIEWARKLRDFKQWMRPTTEGLYDWKSRKLEASIMVAKSTMMDNVEGMLQEIQKEETAKKIGDTSESGTSVYLPVMVTAISAMESPPEREQVIDLPYWSNVIIPTDPLHRVVQMRTQAASYRCQIAFFASDPHSASEVLKQFVNFWKRESKRTFPVTYEMGFSGKDIVLDKWDFRCIENSLIPDNASANIEGATLDIVTIDCVLVGAEPVVVGLGAPWDEVTDRGEPLDTLPGFSKHNGGLVDDKGNPVDVNGNPIDSNGNPIEGYENILQPIPGTTTPADQLGRKVIEADLLDHNAKIWQRININPTSKAITQTGGKLPRPSE